jgi:NitT/TauT family transport system substrate-binding protein
MDQGWNSGDFDMNVLLNNSLQFGVSDATTEASLRNITENYIRLGLIKNMDNVDEIMELAWTSLLG